MERLLAVSLALLLAGCASSNPSPGPGPDTGTGRPTLPDLVLDHDHRDPSLHTAAVGLELAGFLDAKDILGAEPARLSDIQFFGNLSAVTINGRTAGSSGGFALLELTSPTNFSILGRYRSGSEDNWYTKFSPDGKFVFLTANGGTGPNPALAGATQSAGQGVPTSGARGIHIVDISNPAQPKLAAYYPAPVRIINMAVWAGQQATYVAASMTNDRVPRTAGAGSTPSLNYVSILRFDPSVPKLDEIVRWQPADAANVPEAFPHDLAAMIHPLNGRMLLYAAYWDAGGYIVDVADPARPQTLGRVASTGAGDHVHTFKPHPYLLDGSLYAVLAPETFANEPAGTYRVVNVTDARKPIVMKAWTPPPGDLTNTESLLFSPHEFALDGGRLYASSYHGGAWILGVPSLLPRAMWEKSLGDPKRTNDWAVDICTVVPYMGYVYAVDMNAGVLVLHETP